MRKNRKLISFVKAEKEALKSSDPFQMESFDVLLDVLKNPDQPRLSCKLLRCYEFAILEARAAHVLGKTSEPLGIEGMKWGISQSRAERWIEVADYIHRLQTRI